jgi:peptidoglycan/xylan/chitin deacetylase (PgdA/CDA1 family)
MSALDAHGIRGMSAMDAELAENYPFIVSECKKRNWEFVGHGLRNSNFRVSEQTPEEIERAYIKDAIEGLERATGERPVGWFAHDYDESTRTPALLAEQGIQYLMDWPNDEQPYEMRLPRGTIVSIPTFLELEDTYAMRHRRLMVWRWEQMVKDAFDHLYDDGARSGRLFVLSLHPWLIGQASRIKSLEEVVSYISAKPDVWKATGKEIADYYLNLEP